MIWIILPALLFVATIIAIVAYYNDLADSDAAWTLGTLSIIFAAIGLIVIAVGHDIYPSLKREYYEIITMQQNITELKDCRYSTNSAWSDALMNFKQSTTVSEYVKQYINKVAEYNGDLASIRTKKRIKFYWWFGYYPFVSDSIFSLPLIDLPDSLERRTIQTANIR